MAKITHYKVVTALTVNELNSAIASLINDGWEPHGSVAVSSAIYKQFDNKTAIQEVLYSTFTQTMVKIKA